ncbi:hypothetical protein BJ878DRAFT_480357 [Calycina marina]|uniref:Uncharacterized protein n=1 Tax=Calycina marina TaxID=1763456 RepID=A0A9P7Z2U2_9HELO|nr:hypothetical protein BJ878DRAFT_480357 [Calycina marina]
MLVYCEQSIQQTDRSKCHESNLTPEDSATLPVTQLAELLSSTHRRRAHRVSDRAEIPCSQTLFNDIMNNNNAHQVEEDSNINLSKAGSLAPSRRSSEVSLLSLSQHDLPSGIQSPLVPGMLSNLFVPPPLQFALNDTDPVFDFDSSKNEPAKPAASAKDFKHTGFRQAYGEGGDPGDLFSLTRDIVPDVA